MVRRAAALLVGSLAACTSLSGLTSAGGDDAGQPDSSLADRAIGDDALPPPPPDAGGADGASGDAGSDARFCDKQAPGLALCSDFDLGPIAADWTGQVNDVDGGLAIVADGASSAPYALLVRGVPLATVAQQETVEVDRKFAAAGHITYAFDVRFEALDSNGGAVEFAAVAFSTGPSAYSAYHLTARLSGWELGEEVHFADGGATYVPVPLTGTVSASWARIEVEIALDASPRTVTVRRGGSVVGTRTVPSTFPTGPVHVYVGVVYAHGPTEPVAMHFDNVTLRLADAGDGG